jgi:hypothetical protein
LGAPPSRWLFVAALFPIPPPSSLRPGLPAPTWQ